MQPADFHAKILIIDDSPESIAAAAAVLKTADYRLYVAVNAHIAMELITQQPPDLILLDVRMPDVDGFALCRQLKSQPVTAAIPVIFLTASDDETNIRTAFSLGASDYVTKPFKKSELLARVNTQIQLRQQQQNLQKAYQDLDAFCASVAHDLKSPLLTMEQLAAILQQDYADQLPPAAQPITAALATKAQETIAIVDHLLAFSRASKSALRYAPIDMQRLLQELYDELTAEEPQRKIEFTVGPLPIIAGDPILIRQLLQNILSNALKYTRYKEPAQIHFTCSETNREYIFCCKDNGAGFDMRGAHRLFHVFERLHSEREFPGSGVGLAICQRIVQRHGGSIRLTGQPDQGAECWFSLPKKPK